MHSEYILLCGSNAYFLSYGARTKKGANLLNFAHGCYAKEPQLRS